MAIDAAAIAYGAGAVIMAVERWLSGAPKARERLPSVIASKRWEYAPLILLIIAAAIWIARFGFWPHLLEWRWRPISAESPLADNALKWSLQASLRLQSASYRNKCQAVIVHNSSAYSQDFAQDIGEVISASGGSVQTQLAQFDSPKGIELVAPTYSGDNREQVDCATALKAMLEYKLGPGLGQIYSAIPIVKLNIPPRSMCGPFGNYCFVIYIGNQPAS